MKTYTTYMIGSQSFPTLAKAEAEAEYLIEAEGRASVEIDEVRTEPTENGGCYQDLIQTYQYERTPLHAAGNSRSILNRNLPADRVLSAHH